ncbi:uncharacterized protein [Diabrotica undecimpunctata]|uniref:uncharacterized protein n=1 Tax=Diabrotica undecimpunctata TaxID=50387 RepID=UPI003B635E08
MVRNYVRKTEQQSWSLVALKNAIRTVKAGEMGYLKASKVYGIPKATLIRRCKEKVTRISPDEKGLGFYKTVFTKEQEEELYNYILDMEKRLYGITLLDLRHLAFQLAEKNNIDHPYNKTNKLAGLDWAYGFRKRHPGLSLRKPESTSAARAEAFNRYNVKQFFDLYKATLDSKHVNPTRVFNCDETGLGTVPKCNSKILAHKGRKQVGRLTSADRSGITTAVICMSSSGIFIPPMLIFARKRMKVELQAGAPPGSIFACSDSGWINSELFLIWFQHFLQQTKPSEDDPILLILDGHSSHTKNIEVINLAGEKHVHIICLPPHSTHRMQPTDVGVMAPLARYYDMALEKFVNNNPGRVVTAFQISKIFGEAFLQAATPLTAINAFKKCGIVPYDPNIFTDLDFAPSATTERDLENNSLPVSSQDEAIPSTSTAEPH